MKNEELEVNNGLPIGWVYAGLEDISDVDRHSIKRGPFGSALKKEFFVPDGYKVYEQGNVINNDFDRGTYFINDEKFEDLKSFSIKPKDILMSCAGTVGKLAIVPDGVQEGVINQALLKLSVHPDIDLQYFFKLLSYQIDEILKSNLRGSAMMNLTSVKDLKLVKFPIAPLNEQKRIVAKIEKLFSNLDNSDKYLLHLEKQLKRYRKSVLKSAFEGELYKCNFEYETIGNILTIVSGNTPKGLNESHDDNGIYKFFKVGDMNTETNKLFMQDSNLMLSEETVKELKIKLFPKGTVIFPKRGGSILTNKKRILSEESAFDLNTMGIIPNEKVYSLYLYYWFFKLDLSKIYDGSSVPQINNKNIAPLEFPLCQYEEQQEIVNQIEKHFSIIDKLETVVQQSIKESKRLRQSLLKQAFEGKLVEQNPNDESASILLEKISKAKEEYQKVMKRKK